MVPMPITERTTKPWREAQRLVEIDGHWTPSTLGKALTPPMSRQQVYNLLNGRSQPSRKVIRAFANVFRVPVTMIEPQGRRIKMAYSAESAAEMLDITIDEVLALVETGQLRAKKTALNVIISDEALYEYLNGQQSGEVA